MYGLERQRTQGYLEVRDMLYILSGSFASGRGLKEGIRDCCRMLENAHGERSLFLKNVKYMLRSMEEGNVSERDLFSAFVKASGFPELQQMAAIYSLCIQTGGNLPKAMIETSDSMLRKLQLWQEIRSRTSQKRLEFIIMTMIVPLLLFSVNRTSDYFSPLYETVQGRVLMTLIYGGVITAFLWSTWILERGKE